MSTLAYGHAPIYSYFISLERMHIHYAVNSTTGNANFVPPGTCSRNMSQCIDIMITIEGPRLGIDPGISSPQGEHALTITPAKADLETAECCSLES